MYSPSYESEASVTELTPAQRDGRRKWAIEVNPEASPLSASDADLARYVGRWHYLNADVMRDAERAHRVLHCLYCQVEDRLRGFTIHATRMQIVYEEDVLKNYPQLLHGYCHGCNKEEIIAWPKTETGDYITIRELAAQPGGTQLVRELLNQQMLSPNTFSDLGKTLDMSIPREIAEQLVRDRDRRIQLEQMRKVQEAMTKAKNERMEQLLQPLPPDAPPPKPYSVYEELRRKMTKPWGIT